MIPVIRAVVVAPEDLASSARVRHPCNQRLFSLAKQVADVLFDLVETCPGADQVFERLRPACETPRACRGRRAGTVKRSPRCCQRQRKC
jgi:hypothetical protein